VVNSEAGTLTVRDVTLEDEGNYVCAVNTTAQPVVTSTNAHLYVESKSSVASSSPLVVLLCSRF